MCTVFGLMSTDCNMSGKKEPMTSTERSRKYREKMRQCDKELRQYKERDILRKHKQRSEMRKNSKKMAEYKTTKSEENRRYYRKKLEQKKNAETPLKVTR